MLETHQIIIVGAGVAGMTAAYALRNSELDVLVVEQRKDIPNTLNPGKYTRVTFMDFLQDSRLTDAKPLESIIQKYSSVAFDTSGFSIFHEYPDQPFCIINTDKYIRNLEETIKQSTNNIEIRRGIFVRDAQRIHTGIKVIDSCDNEYSGKIVIDCSGTCAVTLNGLDYKKSPVYFTVIGYELENCKIPNKETVRIFMDKTITDNGGGWLYPLSEDRCHFGASVIVPYSKTSEDDLRARALNLKKWELYRKWLGEATMVPGTEIIIESPTLEPVTMYDDNWMGVGDSVANAASYIGEGVRPSALMALAAGEVAIEAFEDNNFSKEKLASYIKEYQNQFGKYVIWSLAARNCFTRNYNDEQWTETFQRIQNNCTEAEFLRILRSEYSRGIVLKMAGPEFFEAVLFGEAKSLYDNIFSLLQHIADAAQFRPFGGGK